MPKHCKKNVCQLKIAAYLFSPLPHILCLLLLLCFSCTQNKHKTTESATLQKSYTPKYAENFALYTTQTGKNILRIFSEKDSFSFVLETNSNIKTQNSNKKSLRTPLSKGVFFSTTHLSFLNALEGLAVVSGFSDLSFVNVDSVRTFLNAQGVSEVGEAHLPNLERITALAAEGIFTSDVRQYPNINTPTVPILEWQETHPLGRTEWLVVFGALLGKTPEAIQKFTEIENRYLTLKRRLNLPNLPTPQVLVGFPYEGQWYAPGGKSYFSRFLSDAHALYPWQSIQKTGSLVVNFEQVYQTGIQAPFWLIADRIDNMQELLEKNPKFQNFKAFKNQRVFNNNKRKNKDGWNEYYETSVIKPDEVLADLCQIFHPALFPERRLYYYKKLR